MSNFWPSAGWDRLRIHDQGQLQPTAAWLARFLDGPELALVRESCAAERRLHHALVEDPMTVVAEPRLQTLADADAADNYRAFLTFRDALMAAGSLEACYLQQVRSARVSLAPPFMQAMAQAIVRHVLRDVDDALEARAGELLFRPQRVTTVDGVPLAGDAATLDLLNETGGFGELGRLLAQAQAPIRAAQMKVLTRDNGADYWRAAQGPREHDFLLDLRHEVQQDLGHGLQFTMARADSGLGALCRVLQRWVQHLLGVEVQITPLSRIDDERWRWHVGLDADATALLNDLYEGRELDTERRSRLISLFALRFSDAAQALPEMAGRPVYLALCRTADGQVRLKPQNLLVNLPLAMPV
ncbi:MAG: hypothetical protein EBQ88_06710 [Betaproteobacteria bacterium]|nr:hypothetical protein [Betaproteobacteria bacterium]